MNALIGVEVGVLRAVEILKKAIESISEFSDIVAISSILHSTNQLDVVGHEDNYSIVLKILIFEEPNKLINRLFHLEQNFFQDYFIKNFRAVLLVYADQMSLSPQLVLPHPQLIENKVFLIGSVEVWANYNHPILEKPLNTLVKDIDLKGVDFVSTGKSLITLRNISL